MELLGAQITVSSYVERWREARPQSGAIDDPEVSKAFDLVREASAEFLQECRSDLGIGAQVAGRPQ